MTAGVRIVAGFDTLGGNDKRLGVELCFLMGVDLIVGKALIRNALVENSVAVWAIYFFDIRVLFKLFYFFNIFFSFYINN
jgi:hypothetical protein